MKITVITGSPRRKGTTALLTDRFIEGANEAGHEVFRFDAGLENLHPCLGCGACGHGSFPYVHKDGMEKLNPELLAADIVVFVTPVYVKSFTAQLKTVLDRFYAIGPHLQNSRKRGILISAAAFPSEEVNELLVPFYQSIFPKQLN